MKSYPFKYIVALTALLALCGCELGSNNTVEEHIQRAQAAEANGDYRGSIIELKNAAQKDPTNAQIRFLMGTVYLKTKQGAEAEKELKQAIQLGFSVESLKVPLGEALLMQGDYQRVLDEITASAITSPQDRASILRMHGDARLGLQRLEQACGLYNEALALDPKHVPAYWGQARCALAHDRPAEARSRIEEALRIDPNNADSWVLLGELEKAEKNLQKAETAYASALKHDPANVDALFNHALLKLRSGDNSAAQNELSKLKEVAPNHFLYHYLQTLVHYQEGRLDAALESGQRTLKVRPDSAPTVLLLGFIHYDKKSYEIAAKIFSRYLAVYPGSVDAHKMLAATYLKLKQPERSLSLLTPLLRALPDDPQILTLAAEAQAQLRRPEEASRLFDKAAQLVQTNPIQRTEIALIRLAAGDSERAIEELKRSMQTADAEPKAQLVLARHYMRNGQIDQALDILGKIEQQQPNNALVINMKGAAYASRQDYPNARKHFERALSLQPSYIEPAVNLAEIDLVEGKPDSARKRFEAILARDKGNIQAMLALAYIAQIEKKEKDYLGWLDKAAKADSKAIKPRALLVNHYLSNNNAARALAVARETHQINPDNAEALALLAHAQLYAGERGNALASYQKLAQISPTSAAALYGLAQAYALNGKPEEARKTLNGLLERHPDHVGALAALSSMELRAGRSDEALRLARRVQSLSPASPTGFILAGDAFMAARRFKEAAEAFREALSKHATSLTVAKYHTALMRAGEARQAEDMIQSWLRQRPGDPVVRFHLAQAYANSGRKQEAIEQYQAILKSMPEHALALNNLAMLYHELKDPRARATAEQAYQRDPGNPILADTLGWILVEQGELNTALELLRKASTAAPRSTEIRYHYAVALARSGDKQAAVKHLQELLASSQDFPQKDAARVLLNSLR